jgi:hypothetical protein
MANASDTPDDISVSAFVKALRQHSSVDSVTPDAEDLTLQITLTTGIAIRVRMTNNYCVGEADVREFLDCDPKLDAVVTLSSWNLVTSGAAEYGRERRKGIFTWKQFFGSLNYRKYWLYQDIPAGLDSRQVAAEKRRRRSAWN